MTKCLRHDISNHTMHDKFGRPDVYFMAHEQQLPCKARDDLAGGIPYLSYDEAYEHREGLLGNAQ